MNGRTYDELAAWEKAFFDINMELGNDVWGARLEGDGHKGQRMRVFVNNKAIGKKVLQTTAGKIGGYPILIEEYLQEDYAYKLSAQQEKEKVELEKIKEEENDTAPASSI